MSYKSRLVFAYYNILRFYCLKKSIQRVLKTWLVLKPKKKIFWKMSKYRNTVFDDFKSRFLVVFFFCSYRHRLVLETPYPDHISPKISKYRTENLHFLSTSKDYVPPRISIHWNSVERRTYCSISKLSKLCLDYFCGSRFFIWSCI